MQNISRRDDFNCTYCNGSSSVHKLGGEWCESCGLYHTDNISFKWILTEGIINAFVDMKKSVRNTLNLLQGNVEYDGHSCNMENCDKDSVETFDLKQNSIHVCRNHWIINNTLKVTVLTAIYGLYFTFFMASLIIMALITL